MIGRTLDHYRIEEKIGTGGMGEIYRARDEHLPRDVAIKVIAPGYLGDQSARRRFRIEALALSKLNHPNIETAYDFRTEDGIDFLVVEYIPGATLKDRIAAGPLPEREIIHLGGQLAEGLAAAHQHGVVHRDLKPGNIMVTPDERLKILDFGLAKLMSPPGQTGQRDHSTTSQPGAGTLAYMAPEQLSGLLVDHRTDIYAAGTVLYESATGRHPFQGSAVGSMVDDILHRPPVPPSHFRSALSSRLEEIMLKCLEKDPENRYQAARELLVDMRRLMGTTDPRAVPQPQRPAWGGLRRIWIGAVAAALVALLLISVWMKRNGVPPGQPVQVTREDPWEGTPAISPDGGRIAYVSDQSGNNDIYLVDVHGGHPIRITDDPSSDEDPAWLPDGSGLVFASDRGGEWGIWKVGQLGGDASAVLPKARQPAVSPDGSRIAFSRRLGQGDHRIGIASLAGPANERILTGDEDGLWDHENPAWSPDGRLICYVSRHGLWVVPFAGGRAKRLTSGNERDFDPVWAPDGSYVYFASFREGTVALWRIGVTGGIPERLTMGTGPESHPTISRDGRRLAYCTEETERGISILDRKSGVETRISERRTEFMASIGPDGTQVALISDRLGPHYDLWLQPLSGGRTSGQARRLVTQDGNLSMPAFSPDGRWIAYYAILGDQRDIWTIAVAGGHPVRFTDHPAADVEPAWSPDGLQLAFVSQRDGPRYIYIERIREGRPDGPARRLETGGQTCEAPVWSPNGRQIAFRGFTEDRAEIYIVSTIGTASLRQVTEGANARRVRWDRSTGDLLVSGNWGGAHCSLRRVSPDGGSARALEPPVLFGPKQAVGLFDITADGRFLVFSREKPRGDIWVLEASRGAY